MGRSMRLWFKRRKATGAKLDGATQQLLDLQVSIREKEIQLDNVKLELEQQRKRQAFLVEEEQHKHRLAMDSANAAFARKEQIWSEDKTRLKQLMNEEKVQFERDLQSAFDIKEKEAISLLKLESAQLISQAELNSKKAVQQLETDSHKRLADLETAHAKALATVQMSIAEEYHSKLDTALSAMHADGNTNVKFLKDIVLEMAIKMPNHPAHNIMETRMISGTATTADQVAAQ